jgi:hypothetical protein
MEGKMGRKADKLGSGEEAMSRKAMLGPVYS